MAKKIRFSSHADKRVSERLLPIIGVGAHKKVKKIVRDAFANNLLADAAPGWTNYRYGIGENSKELGWIASAIANCQLAILVNRESGCIVTVITHSA